jgi:hypothetical protein
MKDDVKDFAPPPDADDPRTPFQRFEAFARRLFAVPKSEIDELRDKDERQPHKGNGSSDHKTT